MANGERVRSLTVLLVNMYTPMMMMMEKKQQKKKRNGETPKLKEGCAGYTRTCVRMCLKKWYMGTFDSVTK